MFCFLAAMAVLARHHSGLWWALLAHSGWVLGESTACGLLVLTAMSLCYAGLWWVLLAAHSGSVLGKSAAWSLVLCLCMFMLAAMAVLPGCGGLCWRTAAGC